MLKVAEIFESIDGEVNGYHQGRKTIFLRLASCNCNCSFCDSASTRLFNPAVHKELSIQQVSDRLKSFDNSSLTITGGEPLLQIDKLIELLEYEHNKYRYQIVIETNGTLDIEPIKSMFDRISFVVDYKLDYEDRMIISNWELMDSLDFIKVVIPNRMIDHAPKNLHATLSTVCEEIWKSSLSVNIAFSPEYHPVHYRTYANKLLRFMDNHEFKDVILNLQLHKIIGVA